MAFGFFKGKEWTPSQGDKVAKQDGPIISQEEMDRVSNELIKKLGLEGTGKNIYLTKQFFNDLNGAFESQLTTGEELAGELIAPVKLGESIDLNEFETGKPGNTSNISRIYESNGKCFVKTRTSVYEIKTQEQIDEISNKLIKEFGLDVVGKFIRLVKRLSSKESDVKSGEELYGKLKRPVKLGESIDLNSFGEAHNTSGIKRVYTDNQGNRFIKTETSVYKLMEKTGIEEYDS